MINAHYDIIIIGSGIAGLYSAYKIKHMNPALSVLILEKNKKQSDVNMTRHKKRSTI
jgi:flavin-dependent dehydrogenase